MNQQLLSRYSRFDDGHPSPSPNREWMHLGTKETSLTIKTHLHRHDLGRLLGISATDDDRRESDPEQPLTCASARSPA
jgi:hypothetical protein